MSILAGQEVFLYLSGVILLFVAGKLFLSPLKTAMFLVCNGMIGIFSLFLLNFFGQALSVTVAFNNVTVIVAALLGLPGTILLFLLQIMGI